MTREKLNKVSAALFPCVRNYLDITWDDPAGDDKLFGIISRGVLYMNRVAGEEIVFLDTRSVPLESKSLELLYDYCRYARSNALEKFEQNYLHELNALQLDYAAAREAKTNEPDADV